MRTIMHIYHSSKEPCYLSKVWDQSERVVGTSLQIVLSIVYNCVVRGLSDCTQAVLKEWPYAQRG